MGGKESIEAHVQDVFWGLGKWELRDRRKWRLGKEKGRFWGVFGRFRGVFWNRVRMMVAKIAS